MHHRLLFTIALVGSLLLSAGSTLADEPLAEHRVELSPKMLTNEADVGDPSGFVDEQAAIIGPPAGAPTVKWDLSSSQWKTALPFHSYIDLGKERNLSKFYFFDTNGVGRFNISVGRPGDWTVLHELKTDRYKSWQAIPMDVTTRYVRISILEGSANFTEIALHEYTPEAHKAVLARKAAEEKAAAERAAALAKAREEMKRRPLVDVGPPFGKLYLIDEIDCAAAAPTHRFEEYPAGASKVQTILGKPCRVMPAAEGEASYMSYRIGEYKLLEPGMSYVLQVVYPEDQPRTMIVINRGCETIRGFHTGGTVGDSLHSKYVNSIPESIATPLSGSYESWTSLFNLHDRFPAAATPRGSALRPMVPENGFTVTLAQYRKRDAPLSAGVAVSKIRLLAVPEPEKYDLTLNLPDDLPKRRIFWREEMADGVIGSEKVEERGVTDYVNWWAFKRDQMKFLGINTYAKDLLEFGACQHWDPSEYGSHDWVYFNGFHKGDWEKIVTMMGEAELDVLPYYEYTGSKGKNGLGGKKRTRPLTRDDAYTHIKWVQSHGVDLTDPDAYADFEKMLDATVLRFKDKANFVGAWLRTRGGMPISFAEPTLERFAKEANNGKKITRQNLIDNKALLNRYYDWWYGKRRDFFVAMRDHLRENGIDDATILYTAETGEPGVGFRQWQPMIPTDQPSVWKQIAGQDEHAFGDRTLQPISIDTVVKDHMFLEALQTWPLTWGGWEWHHNAPPSDPAHYKDTDGVMLSHSFNRVFTVSDPATFEAFRNPTGLTLMRHYCLNENMLFNKDDEALLGYFVADMEKAGPYCMQSEALAVANGDPTWIGYLTGGNHNRGFPQYVRNFNQAFLSLPALPSKVVPGAASDRNVVVREIDAGKHGRYLAIVNTSMNDVAGVKVKLPRGGKVTDAATGEAIATQAGGIELSLYPYQLRAIRIQP